MRRAESASARRPPLAPPTPKPLRPCSPADDLGAGILNNAFDGYNCSLFAYGQTGSGKSYSMVGYGADRGIVPIVCESLFARLAAQASDPDWSAKVTCSMLEIYMEKTRDLLNPSAGDLKVRNDVKKGFFVEGLTANAVADYASIAQLMDAGTKARTVASTAMNATSSRAHTIFQVVLTQTRVDRAAGTAKDKVAVINLIDLAGSERADSTGATGDRLKEGAAINLSLTCLGNCISALAANSDPALKKKARVPYRDSVLTMLLQNSLGGNAKTIMIAALSPADINYEETLSTLRYADRAKQIKNRAVVNEDPNEKLIRGLRDEIDALRRALASGGGSAAAAPDAASSSAAERARLRAEFDAEREAERARMREELETKLKLEFEESKPWEERLADAKERAGARERELREMGVLTGAARAAQLERARAVPHMTNLHEDAQLAEQALFFFEPGRETTVGRKDAPTPPDVTLAGLPGTLPVHALIRCTTAAGGGGAAAAAAQPLLVTVEPAAPGAKVYVDGDLITAATPLHHLARLVFGASQAFKVVMPGDSAAQTTDADAAAPAVDYAFAMLEMSKGQAREFEEQERRRREESAEERRRADARVAELEARMRDERARGEAETAAKLRSMEEQVRASAGNEELLRKLKEEQERFAADAKLRQADLERKLLDQIAETERMRKKKGACPPPQGMRGTQACAAAATPTRHRTAPALRPRRKGPA